jgi:uncharacterized protein (UPF0332 family)
MNNTKEDLSRYRLQKAYETLDTSKAMLEIGKYSDSLNRSYYAVFHSLRAVLALDGFDSKKHSGIISYFNQNYIKNEKIDKTYSKIINSLSDMRNESDYDDFFISTKEDAVNQFNNASFIIKGIESFLTNLNGAISK